MEQAILHHYKHIVKKINQLAPAMEKLSEEEMRAKTKEFQERYQKGTPLSKLLPEAFAPNAFEAYYEEHYETIVREHALSTLSTL